MIRLIPFDKVVENSAGVASLLAKQLIAALTSRTRYFIFSGDLVKHFYFITLLVSRCELVY